MEKTQFAYPYLYPSRDAFGRVFSFTGARNFQDIFIEWTNRGMEATSERQETVDAHSRAGRASHLPVRHSPRDRRGRGELHRPGDISDANDGSLTDISPEEQEWARQGGQAGILLEDGDRDRPLRRVLVLDWDAAGSVDIAAHSNVLKNATLTDWNTTEDGEQLIAVGNYIYLG